MPTFDELFYGIAQQESGGSYSAVNGGSGALGKYQVMPANVPAWSKKYMGQAWTPQQFLKDPAKQESLAKAVLQDYYDKWGARGAASAWYSGDASLNLNYNPQKGGPPIGQYVDEVIGKGMGFPGTPGTAYLPVATTTVDNTVKAESKPQLPGSAGVGAVSAPGVGAVTGTGVGAVGTNGGQAFGEAPTIAPTPAQSTQTPTAPNPGAGTPDPGGEKSLTADTVAGRRSIMAAFPGLSVGGFRSGAGAQDHGEGRAIDVMVADAAKGQAIAAFAQQDKQVSYVIWQQHIWSPARANEGWRLMADRGSPTQNHMDHVHVSYK